jgi:hypothetical protein
MPEKWHTAIICALHKKGDKLQCHNYRGISLLNVCYKVLTNILHRQLVPYAEESLGDYQCGFRKGHQILIIYLCWDVKGKGKAFPMQAWTGPWDSRRLRLQNF